MALSAKLQVRQTQSLVITPQLMLAIRLLQMSGIELEQFVAQEVEQNPFLERDEAGEAERDTAPDPASADAGPTGGDVAEAAAEVDAEPTDLFPEQNGSDASPLAPSAARSSTQSDSGAFDGELNFAATESLVSVLERRIDSAFGDVPADRLVALSLLAGLDEAGYLTEPLELLAGRLGVAVANAEAILARCQELAPTGIFARSLSECLALQLAERNRLDPAMQALLDNLDRLAARDRGALLRLCGVDAADLDEMIAEIRALDPKPGLAYAGEPAPLVAPDVFVRAAPGGGWLVELNDACLPRLLVDRVYFAHVSVKSRSEADRRFLADCLQKANWLEKSLDQRARTVLRVAVEIVRRQDGFLADGVAHLRPLNLRMVADALGIHESTVSRATANKTIATPRGIFEFRYFFTGSIAANCGGEAHSAEAVKHRIRQLISNERPDGVLSDDAIVIALARSGVEIARRTVAKYREVMRIGSSVERRREKRLEVAS